MSVLMTPRKIINIIDRKKSTDGKRSLDDQTKTNFSGFL